ncbi:MAG: manC [Rickettsiaceae bacterium]|jgi:mannose-1-phosphate guanylyltransferase/mannose-6-phosphate isomerase|nr:manC [Rickettsiaceae bacterium]
MKIIPVILSGGFGTRLWPLSRQTMPKQFLKNIFGEEVLFSKALKLVSNQDIFSTPIVVTNQEHKFFVLREYQDLGISAENIILEPCPKNTAIAIICACLQIKKVYNKEKVELLVLSSDHLVEDKELFEASVLNATEVVKNKIITFGVKPNFPATGYGYIKKSKKISENCFAIEKFTEKPNEDIAELFLKDESYLWNAGIFLLDSDLYLEESKKYLSEQLKIAIKSMDNAKYSNGCYAIEYNDYQPAAEISVDYGILEKSHNIAVTELKSRWSDVGDFNSIYQASKKDENNNVIFGDVKTYESSNSLIYSHNSLIACLGLSNIVAVQTDNAILIANKNKVQDIKKIVNDLSLKNSDKIRFHNKVFRPWGYYEILAEEISFKVKRILINARSSISLQLHKFRSEHWVVIRGTATVQNDQKISILNPGESTFIPANTKHKLSNETNDDLEIIEVQMGEYCGEDDIERFEDVYGRS